MGGGGDHAKYRSNQRKNSNYNRLFGCQIKTPEITVELGGGGGGGGESPPLPLPPPKKKERGKKKKRAGSFCVLEWFLFQSKKIKYFYFICTVTAIVMILKFADKSDITMLGLVQLL